MQATTSRPMSDAFVAFGSWKRILIHRTVRPALSLVPGISMRPLRRSASSLPLGRLISSSARSAIKPGTSAAACFTSYFRPRKHVSKIVSGGKTLPLPLLLLLLLLLLLPTSCSRSAVSNLRSSAEPTLNRGFSWSSSTSTLGCCHIHHMENVDQQQVLMTEF